MHRLMPLVELLDRAATELNQGHDTNDHIALILVENAVELMLSYWVHTELHAGDFRKLSASQRKEARKNGLKAKFGVLVFVGDITQEEADYIWAAHLHRNEAYHEGNVSEQITRPLAISLFQYACDLFVRFDTGFMLIQTDSELTVVGRKYLEKSRSCGFGIDRDVVAAALRSTVTPSTEPALPEILADRAQTARKSIADAFRFLLDDNPNRYGSAEMLRLAQMKYSEEQELKKAGLDGANWLSPRHADSVDLVRKHRSKWTPRYRAIPHGAWSRAAEAIRTSANERVALVRFNKLRDQMAYLEDAIQDLAMALDGWIQDQVDIARGK